MVAVALDAVRPEVVGGFREEQSHLGLPAGAGHSGLAVGNEMRGVHDSGLEERQEAKLDGGGVTPRIADDAGALDGGAVHLGQAVDRFGEEIRTSVRHAIPLREDGRILEAKVGGEVDDPRAGAHELAGLRHGHAMRRREEHDIARIETGFGGIDEGERVPAAQAREHVGDRRSGILARRDRANVRLRMLREQPEQFDAGIARSADDAYLDHGFLVMAWISQSILAPAIAASGAATTDGATPAARPAIERTAQNDEGRHDGGLPVQSAATISASRTACACAPCGGRPSCAPLRGHRA